MDYTGRVQVGGAPQQRTVAGLAVTKLAVGPMDNNVYLLRCTQTGTAVLVDAANEADRLLELIGDQPLELIVTTHRHPDHWQALPEVVERTGAPVAAHPQDAGELPVPVSVTLQDGGQIPVGRTRLEVMHLPGHTPGSVSLLYDADGELADAPHLFTGDCLFPGGVGRTTNRHDFETLYSAVVGKVFDRLPDETWVYPGHGDDTTLGRERPHLAEWHERGW